jgi:hypothetical protein
MAPVLKIRNQSMREIDAEKRRCRVSSENKGADAQKDPVPKETEEEEVWWAWSLER